MVVESSKATLAAAVTPRMASAAFSNKGQEQVDAHAGHAAGAGDGLDSTGMARSLRQIGLADAGKSVDVRPAKPIDDATLEKIRSSVVGAWHFDIIVPQVKLLFNFHPDGWANTNISRDFGKTWERRYFDWKIIDAESENKFAVEIVYSATAGGVNAGDRSKIPVTGIASTDPLTYDAFCVPVGMNGKLIRCGTDWNTAEFCGSSHDLGLPTQHP